MNQFWFPYRSVSPHKLVPTIGRVQPSKLSRTLISKKHMLISNKRKFIFVHIYKNAGSSVTNALMPYASNKWQRMTSHVLKRFNISLQFDPQPFPSHIKASELINAMGKEAFEAFFSFAIIRNPWDWQVSLYKYMLKNASHHQHDLVKSLGSFDAYIK